MINLIAYETETGVEVIINHETGESYLSIMGYSMLSGVPIGDLFTTLNLSFNDDSVVQLEEVKTPHGLRYIKLLPESLIAAWITQDNPDIAAMICLVGVRSYLHFLCDFGW